MFLCVFFSMWVVSSGRWPSPTFLACCLYWRCGGQAAKWLGEILEAPRHIKIIEVFWSGTVELHLTSFKFRLFFLRRFWTSNQNSIFYHLLIFPPSKHPPKTEVCHTVHFPQANVKENHVDAEIRPLVWQDAASSWISVGHSYDLVLMSDAPWFDDL